MENFSETPFSRTFGTEREDILLIDEEFSSLPLNQINLSNKKRKEVKKIGLAWMINNYIPLEEFNVNLLHINRDFSRTPGDLWRIHLAYGKDHIPPIAKVEFPSALLFAAKSKIKRIEIKSESFQDRFREIIEEINSMNFIRRVLRDENFYRPTKYKISNLTKKTSGEIKTITVNIEESKGDTLTPFVKLQDFERANSPLVHTNPRSRGDLGISGRCRIKALLHFSHIEATNSQYITTIYVKKCGFE